MTTIQKQVENFIQTNPEIKKAIEYNIHSLRKLAKHISETLETNQIDAIISALRRIKINSLPNMHQKAYKALKNTKIITKSDIIMIILEKNIKVLSTFTNLFEQINYSKGEVLRIFQAEETIKIVIDKSNLTKIKQTLPADKIITIEKNLAEINLILNKTALQTPGIISTIFSELAINNINITDTMSCVPEVLLFVKEKDLLQAYSTLFNILKK